MGATFTKSVNSVRPLLNRLTLDDYFFSIDIENCITSLNYWNTQNLWIGISYKKGALKEDNVDGFQKGITAGCRNISHIPSGNGFPSVCSNCIVHLTNVSVPRESPRNPLADVMRP